MYYICRKKRPRFNVLLVVNITSWRRRWNLITQIWWMTLFENPTSFINEWNRRVRVWKKVWTRGEEVFPKTDRQMYPAEEMYRKGPSINFEKGINQRCHHLLKIGRLRELISMLITSNINNLYSVGGVENHIITKPIHIGKNETNFEPTRSFHSWGGGEEYA